MYFKLSDLKVGDCVFVKGDGDDSYIARVKNFGKGSEVLLTWFYKPEDVKGGRQAWHGEKELFTQKVRSTPLVPTFPLPLSSSKVADRNE